MTATHARLMRPNDNDWSGGGDLDIQLFWSYDGDNPNGGDPSDPKTGLVDYYPVGSKPTEGWHALQVQGYGILDTIRLVADGTFVCDGDITVTAAIQVNDVTVGSDVYASSGGLRSDGPLFDFTITDVAVTIGALVSARFIGTGNIIGGITVPAGLGTGGDMLLIDGDLSDEKPVCPIFETPAGAVDGVNTDFALTWGWDTSWPFWVQNPNGWDRTADIAAQDPVAGTFTLNYAPASGSVIRVRYKAA